MRLFEDSLILDLAAKADTVAANVNGPATVTERLEAATKVALTLWPPETVTVQVPERGANPSPSGRAGQACGPSHTLGRRVGSLDTGGVSSDFSCIRPKAGVG